MRLGEYSPARDLHEDTLARLRRINGDDHTDTRRTGQDLAAALMTLGDTERAATLLAEFGHDS